MLRQLIISLIIALAAMSRAEASMLPGSWNIYPISGEFTGIIDTDNKVWYVTGGILNSYDKDSDETRTYTTGNGLSSYGISRIIYNDESDYLAVVYNDANIDLVYDDGQIVNLPDIKDATMALEKKINDIAFHNNLIYVATEFGLVIFDADRREVKESGIYNNRGVKYVVALDHGVVAMLSPIASGKTTDVVFINYGQHINKLENFDVIATQFGQHTTFTKLSDKSFATILYGDVYCFTVSDDGKKMTYKKILNKTVTQIMPAKGGGAYMLRTTDNSLYHTSALGEATTRLTSLPDEIKTDVLCTYEGPDRSVWAGNNSGLGQYRIDSDGALTVLRDRSRNPEATTFSNICKIFPATEPGSFIVTNIGMNRQHPYGSGDHYLLPMTANYISPDGTITEISPSELTYVTKEGQNYGTRNGQHVLSPTGAAQDPDYPERFYFSSATEGLYVIENGKEVAHFYNQNSPIEQLWLFRCTDVQIDRHGNLWVATNTGKTQKPTISILPAAKRKLRDLSGITRTDWIIPEFGGNCTEKDLRMLICEKSNLAFIYDAWITSAFEVMQHNGDPTDLNSQRHMSWVNINDTDGGTYANISTNHMAEDHNGKIWVATEAGVYCIPNPADALNASFAITKVKVPRNDGTNLADYLLETSNPYKIVVDHSNRKWIATTTSGLYLVSENADEILASYNTTNSPLPSDAICDIYMDPTSNVLYIATLQGLFSLSTTSSPAMPDFKEVLAYPNPLTPDYTGWVTISGLMDNSLVKIVDAGMHLVYQTTSEGGMAVWDGCNLNGQRVRSGVYYVLASSGSGSDSSSEGAVATKILVIN